MTETWDITHAQFICQNILCNAKLLTCGHEMRAILQETDQETNRMYASVEVYQDEQDQEPKRFMHDQKRGRLAGGISLREFDSVASRANHPRLVRNEYPDA